MKTMSHFKNTCLQATNFPNTDVLFCHHSHNLLAARPSELGMGAQLKEPFALNLCWVTGSPIKHQDNLGVCQVLYIGRRLPT